MMMTPKKERAIQSTLLLMLITFILLSFLCFNAYAAHHAKRAQTVPELGGQQLSTPALVHHIDRFILFGYSNRLTMETAKEGTATGYSAHSVNDRYAVGSLRTFRVR